MNNIFKSGLMAIAILSLASCGPILNDPEKLFYGNDHISRNFVPVETKGGNYTLSYLSNDAAGRRVIFLHGTPGQADAFYRLIRNAPGDLEYIAVDRPGWAVSKPTRPLTSLEDQADAIVPLLKEKKGKKPIIVGHSLGGPIAAMIAAKHGDLIGGAILASASMDPELEPELNFLQKVGRAPIISWFVPGDLGVLNDELVELKDELYLLEKELGKISVPITVVHGDTDFLVPYGNVAYMQEKITNAAPFEIITVKGGSHEIPWTRQLLFQQAIVKLASEQYDTDLKDIKIDASDWIYWREQRAELEAGAFENQVDVSVN